MKIAKEKVVLEKDVFSEMFLKFNVTWKYTWSEILKTVKEFILGLNQHPFPYILTPYVLYTVILCCGVVEV